ncbi:MAG TPA: tetratricopeptide repeat protein [Pseudomonadales bacterium]
MPQISPVIFLLLMAFALGLAWLAGYRSRFRKLPGLKRNPEQDYFVGLNYLLNDEPDDAIDIFIDALELNSNTLATHLALCTLLRRRGKVDRAIAHGEYLLADQNFGLRESNEIRINLVRSYLAAGLLDRAEKLLEELKRGSPNVREQALSLAITVYQMEKDWAQALQAALELLNICAAAKRPELQSQAAHFHCELAELALAQQDRAAARVELKKALAINRSNVRVYLMLARIEMAEGHVLDALKTLQKVQQYDEAYAGEASAVMLECIEHSHADPEALRLLESSPGAAGHGSRQLLARVALVRKEKGNAAALRVLQQSLAAYPSLGVLARLLEAAAKEASEQQDVLQQSAFVVDQYLQGCPQYRCDNCGFELKHLYWLCPGCSKWGTVKPLEHNISSVR